MFSPTPPNISLFFSLLRPSAPSTIPSNSAANLPLSTTSRVSSAASPYLQLLSSQASLAAPSSASQLTFTNNSSPETSQPQLGTASSASPYISLFFSLLRPSAPSAISSNSAANLPLSTNSRTSAAALPCLTSPPSQASLAAPSSASQLTFTNNSSPETSQPQLGTASSASRFDRLYEFLANSLSKDDCKILSSLILKYDNPENLRSIAYLIEKQPAKDWLEEHPIDKAALFFLALRLRDPRGDAERIRNALPLNWGLIKWLIDNNKKEALFYLLTEGCQEASRLFAHPSEEDHLFELLQSESFKALFQEDENSLAPFIDSVSSTLKTFISTELLNQQLEDRRILSATTAPAPRRGGHLSKRTAIPLQLGTTVKKHKADDPT